MIQNVLQEVGGIGLYGVISICLFISVFGGMLVWASLLKKPFVHRMSALPLEEEPEPGPGRPGVAADMATAGGCAPQSGAALAPEGRRG